MARATFRVWRGDRNGGAFADYSTEASEGMVVLDAVHQIQAESANDLAVLLRAGALPAPLHVMEERTVGAELGAATEAQLVGPGAATRSTAPATRTREALAALKDKKARGKG